MNSMLPVKDGVGVLPDPSKKLVGCARVRDFQNSSWKLSGVTVTYKSSIYANIRSVIDE